MDLLPGGRLSYEDERPRITAHGPLTLAGCKAMGRIPKPAMAAIALVLIVLAIYFGRPN